MGKWSSWFATHLLIKIFIIHTLILNVWSFYLQNPVVYGAKVGKYSIDWVPGIYYPSFSLGLIGLFPWSFANFAAMDTHERRLLLIIFWKAACVSVTPYLVQLTFNLEACSWKNGDLVFQCLSFFSIVWWVRKKWRMTEHYKHTTLETCMGIDDPYVKKPRWRRKWNAISKMIKKRTSWRDGHQEAVCGGFGPRFDLVSDLVFFSTNRLKSPNHWHVVT